MKKLLPLLFIILSFSSYAQDEIPDSLKFKSLDPDDFLTLMRFEEKAILIDVRLPFEFRKERIEGALNIPVAKSGKKHLDEVKESTVLLLYCTTDVRSRWAALRYFDLVSGKIFILSGGIEAWKRKGLGIEGRVKRN